MSILDVPIDVVCSMVDYCDTKDAVKLFVSNKDFSNNPQLKMQIWKKVFTPFIEADQKEKNNNASDCTEGKSFCLSNVVKKLVKDKILKGYCQGYHQYVEDCHETGIVLIPTLFQIGALRDDYTKDLSIKETVGFHKSHYCGHLKKESFSHWKQLNDTDFEHEYVGASISGHTSYSQFEKKDYEEVKKSFEHLVQFIIENDLIKYCVLDVWNLKNLVSKDTLNLLKELAKKGQVWNAFLLGKDCQEFKHSLDSLIVVSDSENSTLYDSEDELILGQYLEKIKEFRNQFQTQ